MEHGPDGLEGPSQVRAAAGRGRHGVRFLVVLLLTSPPRRRCFADRPLDNGVSVLDTQGPSPGVHYLLLRVS